ncbi:MAG: phosphoglycerate kinase [Candidatus Rhabdochlamydia sp.]
MDLNRTYLQLQDLSLAHKKVLFRVDFNVPLGKNGEIVDDWRIQKSLPSLIYALEQGASVVLITHLGRPEGGQNPHLSVKVCRDHLASLIPYPVFFLDQTTGMNVQTRINHLQPRQLLLLENLRFHPEEETPSLNLDFAKELSQGCDYFVNDAFATLHRHHSSITELPKYFLGKAAMGLLVKEELNQLNTLIEAPKLPFHIITGGNKVSSKIGVLKSLLSHVSDIFIAGAMALPFLQAKQLLHSFNTPDDEYQQAVSFLNLCQEKKTRVHLPLDLVIASALLDTAPSLTVKLPATLPEGWLPFDVGPLTLTDWQQSLKTASTLFWNGPLGVFELASFAKGTVGLAQILSDLPCIKMIGGGDSVAAIQHSNLSATFSHLSTGGGASLHYLEHNSLPGLEALSKRD